LPEIIFRKYLEKNVKSFIKFHINSFEGDYHQIGYNLGKHFNFKNPFLKIFLNMRYFPKITNSSVIEMKNIIKEFHPELLDEMQGFADATKIPFNSILIKLGGYGLIPKVISGCSQFTLNGNITKNGHMYVGRNYDFSKSKFLSDMQVSAVYPKKGFSSIGTSLFVFGRIEGVNEHSLYVGISYGHGVGRSESGIFFPTIVRILLDKCRNLNEAIKLIKSIPHSASYNYLIADKNNACAVEVSPPNIIVRYMEDNLLVVCNHYKSVEMKYQQAKIIPTTLEREFNLNSLIQNKSNHDLNSIKGILSGHNNLGVCMHYYKDFLGTIWSGIFDLTSGEVYYSLGSPCLNEYKEISINKFEQYNTNIKGFIPKNDIF
jgi:predicted choloylglycine hydrolase